MLTQQVPVTARKYTVLRYLQMMLFFRNYFFWHQCAVIEIYMHESSVVFLSQQLQIEGFQAEWYILTIYHCNNIPVWSETLEMFVCVPNSVSKWESIQQEFIGCLPMKNLFAVSR